MGLFGVKSPLYTQHKTQYDNIGKQLGHGLLGTNCPYILIVNEKKLKSELIEDPMINI
jgi:hypothetical protein